MATKQEVISYILKNRRNRILLVATHGIEDAALLGAKVIHLEDCQELTDEMKLLSRLHRKWLKKWEKNRTG